MGRRAWLAGIVALASCGGAEPVPPSPPPATTAEPGPAKGDAPSTPDAGPPPISEAHGRHLLGDAFRGAGLRILSDVEIEIDGKVVAVDGYDPHHRIGFEYVADDERALVPEKRPQGLRILWVGPGDEGTVVRAARQFLDRYQAADTESASVPR